MLEYQGEVREGKVGQPLDPFQIVVKDDEGNPLTNHPLEFLVVEGKGAFTHADSSTDQTGGAIAEFVPEDPGRFRIECRVGADRRETASFKGIVEEETPPKRRQRRKSVRPSAGVPQDAAAPRTIAPPPLPAPAVETGPVQPPVPRHHVTAPTSAPPCGLSQSGPLTT